MISKRLALLALLAMFALPLLGCGGGSSSTASNSSLTRADAQLSDLSTGRQPTDDTTLNATLSLYDAALKQNPRSLQALFGKTVCQAGLAARDLDTDSGLSVSLFTSGSGSVSYPNLATSTGLVASPSPGYGSTTALLVPPSHQLGLLWRLGDGLRNPNTLLNPLTPLANIRYGLVPLYGYANDDVANRRRALQQLNVVTQNLQILESNPDFVTTLFVVTSPSGGSKVGLPEVYLFDAYINSLRAQLALSLAYNRDPSTNNSSSGPPLRTEEVYVGYGLIGGTIGNMIPTPLPPQPTGPSYSYLDKNGDGKLTPDEYLAASPFLTLSDVGMLQTAKQSLQACADKAAKGIQGVFTRPEDGSGGYLINNIRQTPPVSMDPFNSNPIVTNSDVTHSVLQDTLVNVVTLLEHAADGPVSLYVPYYAPVTPAYLPIPAKSAIRMGNHASRRVFLFGYAGSGFVGTGGVLSGPFPPPSDSVTLNLAAWFANPPADLKVFAPTFTLDSNGFVDFTKITYPDRTFGGVFPNGLPIAL